MNIYVNWQNRLSDKLVMTSTAFDRNSKVWTLIQYENDVSTTIANPIVGIGSPNYRLIVTLRFHIRLTLHLYFEAISISRRLYVWKLAGDATHGLNLWHISENNKLNPKVFYCFISRGRATVWDMNIIGCTIMVMQSSIGDVRSKDLV